jgi:hypothetical protein
MSETMPGEVLRGLMESESLRLREADFKSDLANRRMRVATIFVGLYPHLGATRKEVVRIAVGIDDEICRQTAPEVEWSLAKDDGKGRL